MCISYRTSRSDFIVAAIDMEYFNINKWSDRSIARICTWLVQCTNIIIFHQEEDQKRKKRAARFGSQCQKLQQELNQVEKDEQDQFEQKKYERLLRFGPTESQNKIDGNQNEDIQNNDEIVLPR